MTSRIALAILLTTWIVLIIGETAAFYTARQSMLRMLDENLITRATGALEMEISPHHKFEELLTRGDHYEIRRGLAPSTMVAQSGPESNDQFMPIVTREEFATASDGKSSRVIELQLSALREGKRIPYTITYSRSTPSFDALLATLAGVLVLIGLICGLATAWVSFKLSRSALRPLRETSEILAQIDERQLSRRLDAKSMPAELSPLVRRLNEMLARLEDVFQRRKQFLADAAHELRTPTAALLTTLEVAMRRPRDHAALLDALQTGLTDAQRLRRLVESLMEQARSEVNHPTPLSTIDVPAMLRECSSIIAPLASEKGVEIVMSGAIPPHLHFVTQPERLRSVVLNLLSNAIEYNYAGGSVMIDCERNGPDNPLHLTIRDTGIGIAADQMRNVFEPFNRAGTAGRGDDAQHLGLGLFLVKSHVEALRGQCRIESQPGKGTTMHITLPEGSLTAANDDSVVPAESKS